MEIYLERVIFGPDLGVGVVSRKATLTQRLASILGGSGSGVVLASEEIALQHLGDVQVVVVGETDLSAPQALTADPGYWGARSSHSVVVCTVPNVGNLTALLPFPSLRVVPLGIADWPLLSETVRYSLQDYSFMRIHAFFRSKRFHPPLLHQALLRAFSQSPPFPEDAVEALASGKEPFLRTVKGIARALGCSPEYLSRCGRDNGLSVSDAVRWGTFFRGMVIRRLPKRPWSEVALRLGFKNVSSWTNFVKRLVGMTPSEAERVPLRVWEARVLEVVNSGAPVRRQDRGGGSFPPSSSAGEGLRLG